MRVRALASLFLISRLMTDVLSSPIINPKNEGVFTLLLSGNREAQCGGSGGGVFGGGGGDVGGSQLKIGILSDGSGPLSMGLLGPS